MALECIKNCCKSFLGKEKETQEITVRMPPARASAAGGPYGPRTGVGVSEDYLLSKLPPDGKDVPFVLPTFKPSYVQPRGSRHPNEGLEGTARTTYAERKAELSASSHIVYNPDFPGAGRRGTARDQTSIPHASGWDLKNGRQRLSSSMFDLTNSPGQMQRGDSVSSVQSSTSSMKDSTESSRSLESVSLSGEERELGKVCVRVSYQEALEQVWITLVQCSDLSIPLDSSEQQRVGVKGIITMAKPIQFKSSVKEVSQEPVFMETFVFSVRLQPLRCSALVLRLQTQQPRRRTVAEGVLSLRQLGPKETQHWLHLSPPSKTSVCHCELHLATCFQPVSGRLQLHILSAQNLPASSTPLSQGFFVKVELLQLGRVLMKKKTPMLRSTGGQCEWAEAFHFPLAILDQGSLLNIKVCSRSSVRRKRLLGQVELGYDSSTQAASEQWRDSMSHPEKVVLAWHRLS
ncbi:tandem C2 domains nuclear protein [Osmerus eperlanus]|uniref:tandem C2 domains nuclear protein n=1 Tax=Osmerus eperlanus TaxID=29151 RepID=UPI002E0FBAF9